MNKCFVTIKTQKTFPLSILRNVKTENFVMVNSIVAKKIPIINSQISFLVHSANLILSVSVKNVLRQECVKVLKEMKDVRVTQTVMEETIVMKDQKNALHLRRDQKTVRVIMNVKTAQLVTKVCAYSMEVQTIMKKLITNLLVRVASFQIQF